MVEKDILHDQILRVDLVTGGRVEKAVHAVEISQILQVDILVLQLWRLNAVQLLDLLQI